MLTEKTKLCSLCLNCGRLLLDSLAGTASSLFWFPRYIFHFVSFLIYIFHFVGKSLMYCHNLAYFLYLEKYNFLYEIAYSCSFFSYCGIHLFILFKNFLL